MNILTTSGWGGYELIDSGEGYRLERFGAYRLIRPDPQAIWKKSKPESLWNSADATFEKKFGREQWNIRSKIPEKWLMKYQDIAFWAKLAPFKHTGVFPEQKIQWDWMAEQIKKSKKQPHILNLFGYTGIATLIAAKAGARVTHVDASKPTIVWARDNQEVSQLNDKPIRWLVEDSMKYIQREIRRGVLYDGIIMDPPIYGHGPHGELWDFPVSFPKLLKLCQQVLSKNPLFIIINAYAISSSALMLENMLEDIKKEFGGTIEVGELALQEKDSERLLSTGIYARWFC